MCSENEKKLAIIRSLSSKLKIEEIANKISIRLIQVSPESVEDEIRNALKLIGENTSTDRCYIFMFTEDNKYMVNTHEWCAEGISPQIDNLSNLSADQFPWWTSRLLDRRIVKIPNVCDLGQEAEAERKLLQEQKIKSLIAVPLLENNKIFGYVGFDYVANFKHFTNHDISMLQIIANIFSSAITRSRITLNLYHSEKRYRLMFEKMNKTVVILEAGNGGRDFYVKHINNAAGRIFPGSPDEILDKNLLEIYPELYNTVYHKLLQKVFATGIQENLKGDYKFYSDVHGIWETEILKLSKSEIAVLAEDITEKEQHKEHLDRASRIVDNIQVGLHIYKLVKQKGMLHLKLIDANRTSEVITGYKRENIIDKSLYELFPDLKNHKASQVLAKALRKQESLTVDELEYFKEDNTRQVYSVKIFPVSGNEVGVAFEDIAEKKRTAEGLKEAYNVINKSPAIMFQWQNTDGWPVKFVTENVLKLTGYSSEEFISGKIEYGDIIYPEDFEKVKSEVVAKSSDGAVEDFVHHPYRIITKDGAVKWVGDLTKIQKDETGTITHYQGIVVDVTDQIKIEEAKFHQERLQGALELAGAVCHELNQPLQIISGYISILNSSSYNIESIDKILNIINDSTIRMGEITENLQKITQYKTKEYLNGVIIDLKKASIETKEIDDIHKVS